MNSTNETKMDMKQAKQNNTPNIRWTLVGYDLIVYALVAVILLVLYGGMDKLSTVGIFQQVGLSVLCIFTARLIGKIYGQVWRYGGIQCYIRLLFTDSFFSMAGMIFPMVAAFLLARSIEWYWVYACIGLVYVAIFLLTFGCEFPALGKHAQQSDAPVVKEKWGIGVLFLAIAALCYILGQLGFISWVPEYAKSLGMSLNDAGKLVSDFWMSYMVGMWAFSFILRFFDLQRILTVLAGLATVLMYLFITGTPEHMPWFILTLGFFSSAIYTTIITLGSQQTKVASPKLVNFVLTCGTIGTMLTFVVTGPIVAHSGPQAALQTANGLYAVVFVMCFILGFVTRHRQHNAPATH